MQWKGRRGSRNIEDRRGSPGGGFGGGLGGINIGGGRVSRGGGGRAAGVGGVGAIIMVVVALLMGVDPAALLGTSDNGAGTQGRAPTAGELSAQQQTAGEFVSVVLGDTEEIWARLFQDQLGRNYAAPTLVLFDGATRSACGGASEATGPFYCPADRKVYLDTGFFATLERQLGAKGDFAAAYVVAHEVGHAIQDQLGILSEANQVRQQVSERESNQISVMIELQADCLSGIWAREAEANLGVVEPGDLEEAVNAAHQIGDDTLQRNAGQRVSPHTFTHGTSKQRARWFEVGYASGQIDRCNTFRADTL